MRHHQSTAGDTRRSAPRSENHPGARRAALALVGVVVAGAAVIAGIGFTGSYAAVKRLAQHKGFGAFSGVFPIGIDAGIVVLLALDLLLTWRRMPYPLLRQTAWLLTAATIAFNAASAWPDPLGVGMHAVIPVLFIVVMEAGRHAIGRTADITADRHMEGVRLIRWLLAPVPTFRLWRRMKLWEIRSYEDIIAMERNRMVYREHLAAKHGRNWKRRASLEEMMPLRLARFGVPVPEIATALPPELESGRSKVEPESSTAAPAVEPMVESVPMAVEPVPVTAPVEAAVPLPQAPARPVVEDGRGWEELQRGAAVGIADGGSSGLPERVRERVHPLFAGAVSPAEADSWRVPVVHARVPSTPEAGVLGGTVSPAAAEAAAAVARASEAARRAVEAEADPASVHVTAPLSNDEEEWAGELETAGSDYAESYTEVFPDSEPEMAAEPAYPTGRSGLEQLYWQLDEWERGAPASTLARELGPRVGLTEGTARKYIGEFRRSPEAGSTPAAETTG